VELFDFDAVGKTAARFDQQKLDWLNAHHLRATDPADLAATIAPMIGIDADSSTPPLAAAVSLLTERSGDLCQLAEGARFFYQRPEHYQEKAVKKHLKPATWPLLQQFVERCDGLEPWDAPTIHEAIATICQQAG